MAGHTNRLNLYLPGGGSSGLYLPDEQLDVDRINDNMKLLDDAIGFQVVTSGTRPASPYTGKGIFETDTKRIRLWTGVTWAASTAERGTAALFTAVDIAALLLVTGPEVIVGDLCVVQSTGILYRYNGTGWRSAVPYVTMRPVTTANTSGTCVIEADGSVTFTGCSSVSLDGVFDGIGGDVYEVIVNGTTISAASVATRLRVAGVDYTAALYSAVGMSTTLAAGPTRSATSVGVLFGQWCPAVGNSGNTFSGKMTLFQPNKAGTAQMILQSYAVANSDRYSWVEGGSCAGTKDGITIFCSAGVMTGTIKVVKLS